ncbi:protein kinase domain-containing protein [Piscinibacter sp.]|uniref:protein kinase domain-containing protein n=1 Tax=Piscinibacter sp. TaxID=1903157 RepID=UPI0039E23CA7
MNADELRRVNALLEAALALPAPERAAWMHALPAPERELLPLLRDLLARADTDSGDAFLRAPLDVDGLNEAGFEPDRAGDVVGPYRLLREIGRGGMATVWLAERIDGSLARLEALKLPHAGWASSLAQRMTRERDILAVLEHPRIARLYDAGVTPAGRPWLAMEYVDGVTIDRHCVEHALDIAARLRLFLQVAEAVSHAHGRLIVHRDLKPSNILVTPSGEVRLLDFGVAKLLHDDDPARAQLTRLMGRAVTPDYASPEQVGGRPVGVATDVYSLGVVLYELLAGARPYRLPRDTPAALEEAVLAADVPPASTRAPDRRTARALRGDLDTLLAKAMRKDPAQRYRSVEAFAADIERHLAGAPLLARPYGVGERLAKAAARHRLALAAGGAVAAALIAGTALATWQAREAERERDQARALLARNDAINEFFGALFTEAVEPAQAEAVRQMLERGRQMVAPAFGAVPEHEAAILRILAEYQSDPQRSDALLERAGSILRESDDRTLRAQIDCDRGQLLESLGRSDEAVRLLQRWIADRATPDLAAAHCLQMRGAIAANRSEPRLALQSAQAALARLQDAGRGGGALEAELLGDIAFALHADGRSGEAEQWFERSQARYRALHRLDSLHARVMLSNWGVAELASGDVQRALARYDELLAGHRRRMAWRDPPSWLLGNRAMALERIGRWNDALAAYRETLAASERAGHAPGSRYGLAGMAGVLLALGRPDEAEQALQRAAGLPGADDAGHPASIRAEWMQARLLLRRGDAAQAQALLSRQLARLRSIGANPSHLGLALRGRAEASLALGRAADAAVDAREALAIGQRLQGGKPHSDHTGQAWLLLARAGRAGGNDAEAAAAFDRAVEHLAASTGADSPESVRARALRDAVTHKVN